MLEEHAARLAARNITPKDVAALEKLADSLDSAVAARRVKDIAVLEREFHFTIYRAAKGRHLLQLIEALWAFTAHYMSSSARPAPDEWANERYVIRNIVTACQDRDENALGLMIRYKVRRDAARLLELMDRPESVAPPSGVRARMAPQRKAPQKTNVSARRSRRG
jgi:DNA-binding GntR family transcriptional regulator